MRLSSCLVLAIAGTVSLFMAPHSVLARETPSLRRAIGESRHRKGAFSPDREKPTNGIPNNLSSFMSDLTTVSNEQVRWTHYYLDFVPCGDLSNVFELFDVESETLAVC